MFLTNNQNIFCICLIRRSVHYDGISPLGKGNKKRRCEWQYKTAPVSEWVTAWRTDGLKKELHSVKKNWPKKLKGCAQIDFEKWLYLASRDMGRNLRNFRMVSLQPELRIRVPTLFKKNFDGSAYGSGPDCPEFLQTDLDPTDPGSCIRVRTRLSWGSATVSGPDWPKLLHTGPDPTFLKFCNQIRTRLT